jgi:hypothetical protein
MGPIFLLRAPPSPLLWTGQSSRPDPQVLQALEQAAQVREVIGWAWRASDEMLLSHQNGYFKLTLKLTHASMTLPRLSLQWAGDVDC